MNERRAFVLTVSDGVVHGERVDESGAVAAQLLTDEGLPVDRAVVPDDADEIEAALRGQVELGTALVITTGGTGLGPRDVTPEATRRVLEREAPGISELLRMEGLRKTSHSALSRGVAGTTRSTLIVNLPGSRKAVEEGLGVLIPLLPHAMDLVAGRTDHKG